MASLALVVKQARIIWMESGAESYSRLSLKCVHSTSSGFIEIGDRFILSAKVRSLPFTRRKQCEEFELTIERKSRLAESTISKIGLSNEKIGDLTFIPPSKSSDFMTASPAAIDATVFASDQLFDTLWSALQHGNKIEFLYIDIEKKDVLRFGSEPDGSRKTWDISEKTGSESLDITEMTIGYRLRYLHVEP